MIEAVSPGTGNLALWSDEPSLTDLLSFGAVAATVSDAVLDERLDPLALGLSGPWGSGKTTVLGLVRQELEARNSEDAKVILVSTDPWRYDPATGAKESLISEVLVRLTAEVKSIEKKDPNKVEDALKLVKRLAGRVNWSKAIQLAAKTTLALQLPSVDELFGLINEEDKGEDAEPRGMEGFRDEFGQLMGSDALKHVRRVVVLVDDLDRCLPGTVIETLEAIRLFLAVPRMSFVLAADDELVAEAIRTAYPGRSTGGDGSDVTVEEPAKLYLHKIVQTTVPLPALSRFDTQAYLLLLQLQMLLSNEQLAAFVDQCQDLRLRSGDLDELPGVDGVDITEELAFAARLTPLLYEKLRGSPRRIKRFLNDLHVRQAVASRRGIELDPGVVAKLMVLEVLLPSEFARTLEWLATGTLRERLDALEVAAGRPAAEEPAETGPAVIEDAEGNGKIAQPAQGIPAPDFSEGLIRWARLFPPLGGVDLAGYLYLAAAFQGKPLLDSGLPERLQDIAANLLSSQRQDQKSVADQDLRALTKDETRQLVQHLGRMGRDRPTDQRKAVLAIKRAADIHPDVIEEAKTALLAIPPDEVSPATPLVFKLPADSAYRPVLEQWRDRTSRESVREAVNVALTESQGN